APPPRARAVARIGQRVARPDPAARVPRRLHAVPCGLGRAAPHRALGGIGADGRGRGGLRQRRPPGLRAPRGVADPCGPDNLVPRWLQVTQMYDGERAGTLETCCRLTDGWGLV